MVGMEPRITLGCTDIDIMTGIELRVDKVNRASSAEKRRRVRRTGSWPARRRPAMLLALHPDSFRRSSYRPELSCKTLPSLLLHRRQQITELGAVRGGNVETNQGPEYKAQDEGED